MNELAWILILLLLLPVVILHRSQLWLQLRDFFLMPRCPRCKQFFALVHKGSRGYYDEFECHYCKHTESRESRVNGGG